MKKILLFIILQIAFLQANAQTSRILITGKVIDSLQTAMPSATVMLLNAKDSSMVNFGRTEENGVFEFKGVKRGNYFIKISSMGYVPAERLVKPTTDEEKVNLGEIRLNGITKELMEVVIKATKQPLNVKGDTIVYNASSFKVGVNATVEDLLKKLPGVVVAADGSIKAQGKEVQKVTVDGKTFFGDDPKLATKNLPAEAVNQVEIFDDKTEEAKATGIEDGKKVKTINLALKEDFKKGGFGKIVAGAGSNERFEGKGNYNKFNQKVQFSMIGMANNTNQQGFSFDDYQGFKGNQSFNFEGGNDFGFSNNNFNFGEDFPFGSDRGRGFSNSYAGGMNFNFDQKKTKVSSSYFYNFNKILQQTTEAKTTFLENSSFKTTSNQTTNQLSGNHRLNVKYEQGLDSLTTLITKVNSSYVNQDDRLTGLETFFGNTNEKTTTSERNTGAINGRLTLNSSMTLRHKFKKKGRSFSVKGGLDYLNNDGTGNQNSVNSFFTSQTVNDLLRNIRQLTANKSEKTQVTASVGYSEPLSKKITMQVFYNYGQIGNTVGRDVSDKNSDQAAVLNKNLSRYFINDIQYNNGGINFRYAYKGLNISAGVAAQDYNIDASNAIQKSLPVLNTIKRNFVNILPKAEFSYDFKNNASININYSADLRQPSIEEIQPIVDYSNPFYISEGNPALRPQVNNQVGVSFYKFDMATSSNFYSGLNYTYNVNQIIYNQVVDNLFITRSRPENITGGDGWNLYAGYGFPILKNKIKFDLGVDGNLGQNITFINGKQNNTNTNGLSSRIGLDINPNTKLNISLSSNIGQNRTKYSISTSQNQTFSSNNYGASFRYEFPKDVYLSSGFKYQNYRNNRFNFNQGIPLWEAAFSKIFLKSKKAEIKLSITDILNRNRGIEQQAMGNYVSQQQTLSLGRFALLSFTYSIKGLGKPKGESNSIIIIN